MPYIHHLLGNTTFFHDLGTAVLARFIGTSSIGEEVCLHKGATCRVRTGDQWLPDLCHCQLGQEYRLLHWSQIEVEDIKFAKNMELDAIGCQFHRIHLHAARTHVMCVRCSSRTVVVIRAARLCRNRPGPGPSEEREWRIM